jgi:hypothetical protein
MGAEGLAGIESDQHGPRLVVRVENDRRSTAFGRVDASQIPVLHGRGSYSGGLDSRA